MGKSVRNARLYKSRTTKEQRGTERWRIKPLTGTLHKNYRPYRNIQEQLINATIEDGREQPDRRDGEGGLIRGGEAALLEIEDLQQSMRTHFGFCLVWYYL